MQKSRLNKFISHNTSYSRREADELIKQGKVSVNGRVVSELATSVSDEDKEKNLRLSYITNKKASSLVKKTTADAKRSMIVWTDSLLNLLVSGDLTTLARGYFY